MRDTAPVDRFNRFLLLSLSLVLLIGGAAVAAVGLGAFGTERAGLSLVPQQTVEYVTTEPWVLPVTAAVAVVVGLLLLRLLVAQLRTQHSGELDLGAEDRRSTTTLAGSALAAAAAEEAEGYHGVRGADAQLYEEHGRRWLRLDVTLDERADVAEVARRIEQECVAHVRQALEDPAFPLDVRLRPTAAARTGVR